MSFIKVLNFPKANLKLTKEGEVLFVWCIIRKKKLVLTPEEWVRQHAIHYLIEELKVPIGRIASEFTIKVNELTRRCDIVVFDVYSKPKMIVECKATDVKITEQVFYQIAHYNNQLQVDFLMLTNGINHFYAKVNYENGNPEFLESLENVNW